MTFLAGALVLFALIGVMGGHYRRASRIDTRAADLRRAGDQPERTTMRNHAGTSGMIF